MRVVYADPGLRDNLGHHANNGRAILAELRRRGASVTVLASAAITEELREGLQATPFFRVYTYWQSDGDPYAGWLNCFDNSVRATVEDLSRIKGLQPDDLFYLNSAQPAQFMALVRWLKAMEPSQRPHVVMEFGTDPGIDVESAPDGKLVLRPRDFRVDPRVMFYRHAACQLSEEDLARFHLITFDAMGSAIFAAVLGRPVGVLPLPQFSGAAVKSRVGRRPITVALLGHQRPDKGYHRVPEAARTLLAEEPDIRLLIHNSAPSGMPETQSALRALAANEPRLTLNEQTVSPELWRALLDQSDLILCPYEYARFVASSSALASEALANGIPITVPARTTLSRLLDNYGGPGTVFDTYTPAGIVAATRQALADYDTLAARAANAAATWEATMGVRNMVQALLDKAK